MKELSKEDLHEFCRTCLVKHEHYLHNILEPEIRTLLEACLLLKIDNEEDNNDLPKFLCTKCYRSLVDFEKLRTTVEESNKVLDQLFSIEYDRELQASKLHDNSIYKRKRKSDRKNDTRVSHCRTAESDDGDDSPTQLIKNDPDAHECLDTSNANVQLNIEKCEIDSNEICHLDEETVKLCEDREFIDVNPLSVRKDDSDMYYENELQIHGSLRGNNLECDLDENLIDQDDYSHQSDDYESNKTDAFGKNEYVKKLGGSGLAKQIRRSKWKCTSCPRSFISEENLEAHIRTHQGLRAFQCSQCERSFNKKIRLSHHMDKVHSKKPEDRADSESVTSKLDNVLKTSEHVDKLDKKNTLKGSQINSPPKAKQIKLQCTICPRTFVLKQNLDAHLRTHQGLRAFQCTECNCSYNKKNRLKLHIAEVHCEKPKDFKCSYEGCDKVYHRIETFKAHIRMKHIEKSDDVKLPYLNYMCEDCGKSFKNMHTLKEHQYKHLPVSSRPYGCDLCEKRFITQRSLNDHKLRHAGIKNFECSYCGMKKTTKKELRTHINYHTKEKQWQCPLCPAIFNSSGNLKLHDRVVHKGIRKYKCHYCDESFGKPDTLKYHEMRHTGEKPNKCNICGKCFIQVVALKTHMKVHIKPRLK